MTGRGVRAVLFLDPPEHDPAAPSWACLGDSHRERAAAAAGVTIGAETARPVIHNLTKPSSNGGTVKLCFRE